MQLFKAQKAYDDFLVFEKQALINFHWTLDQVEDVDYYELIEILNVNDEEVQQEEVYDDPMELMNKINSQGHT